MESGPNRIGRLIEESLRADGVKSNEAASESVEGKIQIRQEELRELNAKDKEAETAAGWSEQEENDDFKRELDGMSPELADAEIIVDVDEEAMKSFENEGGGQEEADLFRGQRERFQKGEINLDDAANSVLSHLAKSIAEEGGVSDPKRIENMIQQSRGMMQMHLKGSAVSEEVALNQVRSFMTKLLGGKEKVAAEVSAEAGGTAELAGEIDRIRRIDESQRGQEVRAMLESAAREILGGDVEEKKVVALAEQYEGLVRTFFKLDQLSSDEIASQLDRQMRRTAGGFRKSA